MKPFVSASACAGPHTTASRSAGRTGHNGGVSSRSPRNAATPPPPRTITAPATASGHRLTAGGGASSASNASIVGHRFAGSRSRPRTRALSTRLGTTVFFGRISAPSCTAEAYASTVASAEPSKYGCRSNSASHSAMQNAN
jgi:hypothetical protein